MKIQRGFKCPKCDIYSVPPCPYCRHVTREAIVSPGEVGTELANIIPRWLRAYKCQKCDAYSAKMNRWGIQGCIDRKAEIMDHLVRQASQMGVPPPEPVSRTMAKRWTNQAIRNAIASECGTPNKTDERWCVTMTTAPRMDATVYQSVKSLRVAGWEPVVFAEPGSLTTNCKTIQHENQKGCWFNWLESAKWAIENTNAKHILTVQDDALFHPDSRTVAEAAMWPDEKTAFVSLYMSKIYGLQNNGSVRPAGVHQIITNSLWGAVALVFPRESLEEMLETNKANTHLGLPPSKKRSEKKTEYTRRRREWLDNRRQHPEKVNNSDFAIGKMAKQAGRKMFFVVPSPVRHVAKVSAVGHGGNTGARNCFPCADHGKPLAKQVWPDEA